jgi:hypothetical protein
MTKATLKDQVGRNIFTYVDVTVAASKKKCTHITDLIETFANMCEAHLKFNPDKCVSGVLRGKVLGCLISIKGIELNYDKIRAIIQMKHPQSRKGLHKLIGRIATLNRFIAKLAKLILPFFTVLRGSTTFEWGPKQQKACDNLKAYLQQLPVLSSPKQGQPLIMYDSASHTAVNRALVQEKVVTKNENKMMQQFLVYFASEVLAGSKRYDSEMEKNQLCNSNECKDASSLFRGT